MYAGLGEPSADRLLAELASELPATPVLVAKGVLEHGPSRFATTPNRVEAFSPLRPAADYGHWAGRVLELVRRRYGVRAARPEALYGYEAARVVLDAIKAGGARRASVVRAGLEAGPRRSPLGRYEMHATGEVSGQSMLLYDLRVGRFVPESTVR
jgi:hypothetical protein